MNNKLKLGITVGIALLLIACGSGTAVPKKKPTNYKTPTVAPTVTAKANDKCTIKGATIKISGKIYKCQAASRRDPTLRWKR